MKLTFDHLAASKILRDGITKGYWTLEDLDCPPPGTKENLETFRRHPMAANYTGRFPSYRNLLRDNSDSENIPEDDFIL
jgi:hypothetical protein